MATVTPSTVIPVKGAALLDCDGLPVSRHKDVFAALCEEHHHFNRMLAGWDAEWASARNGERLAQIARHLIHDLSAHTAFEQSYIQPLMASKLGPAVGGPMVAAAAQDDAKDKSVLAELEALDIVNHTATAHGLFQRLKADLLEHMAAEEDKWWPALHAKMSHAELEALHKTYAGVRSVLPTHPHPLLGNNPLIQKIAGPVVGIIDRAYDMATGTGGPTSGSSVPSTKQ